MNRFVLFSLAIFVAIVSVPTFAQDNAVGSREGSSSEEGEEDSNGWNLQSDSEPEDFKGVFTRAVRLVQRQVMRRHNHYRRLHNVPGLQDDEKLNRYAQAWANELAKRGRVEHRKRSKYGENIFEGRFGKDRRMKGRRAVDHWYDEIEDYDFGKGGRQRGTEGFTQVVWRNSSLLGTGAARGRGNKYYIVSVYDPKGNVRGQYRRNVNRPAEEGGNEKTNSKADQKPEPAPRPPRLQVAPPAHVPQSKPGPRPRPQQNPSTPIRFQPGQVLTTWSPCPKKRKGPTTFTLKVGP